MQQIGGVVAPGRYRNTSKSLGYYKGYVPGLNDRIEKSNRHLTPTGAKFLLWKINFHDF